jgi:hypothetical protein
MGVLLRVTWICCRVAGGMVALLALRDAWNAMWFRLESFDELKMIEQADFELGGVFALAILLFLAPNCRLNAKLWLIAIIGAIVIWTCVSGLLISSHQEQYHIRSSWSN